MKASPFQWMSRNSTSQAPRSHAGRNRQPCVDFSGMPFTPYTDVRSNRTLYTPVSRREEGCAVRRHGGRRSARPVAVDHAVHLVWVLALRLDAVVDETVAAPANRPHVVPVAIDAVARRVNVPSTVILP